MTSVIEEKGSRVLDVLVSSVKPFELMMGKILGVASVAVTQIAIWAVLVCGLSAAVLPALMPEDMMQSVEAVQAGQMTLAEADLDAEALSALTIATDLSGLVMMFVWLLLFLLGGFLFYSAMFAAVGSAVDSIQDANQLQTPITVPIILALIMAMSVFNDPNSPVAFWFSMIPFTSPIVMIARIPFGIAVWEIWLSIGILYATFILTTWLAAKIYRIGIFMHGKRPSWRELASWLKIK